MLAVVLQCCKRVRAISDYCSARPAEASLDSIREHEEELIERFGLRWPKRCVASSRLDVWTRG